MRYKTIKKNNIDLISSALIIIFTVGIIVGFFASTHLLSETEIQEYTPTAKMNFSEIFCRSILFYIPIIVAAICKITTLLIPITILVRGYSFGCCAILMSYTYSENTIMALFSFIPFLLHIPVYMLFAWSVLKYFQEKKHTLTLKKRYLFISILLSIVVVIFCTFYYYIVIPYLSL